MADVVQFPLAGVTPDLFLQAQAIIAVPVRRHRITVTVPNPRQPIL